MIIFAVILFISLFGQGEYAHRHFNLNKKTSEFLDFQISKLGIPANGHRDAVVVRIYDTKSDNYYKPNQGGNSLMV